MYRYFISAVFIVFWLLVGTESLFAQTSSKLSTALKIKSTGNAVRILVNDTVAFRTWLNHHPAASRVIKRSDRIFSIDGLTALEITQLTSAAGVVYIDQPKRKAQEERALGDFDLTLNTITTAHHLFPFITGSDITVSVKEKPFDQHDLDLLNRVVLNDQFDEAPTLHATSMATIVAGAGNTEPSGRGVARGAKVTTSDFAELLPDDGTELTSLGVTIQNHSYGVGIENYYGIESNAYDKHCRDFPAIIHIFSSGNEGDKAITTGTYANLTGFANLTGQFKVSKNVITVGSADKAGNVVAKSSRGPAYDGRVKPELIAYGDAGSSDAAAVVSGIAALLQQAYTDVHGVLPSSSLIKAALINSANDVGRSEVDFETGYGNADAVGALRTITNGNFFQESITQGQINTHVIEIPAGISLAKITLVWNDVEALPETTTALVNDLDLTLTHVASNTTWQPWVLNHQPDVASLTEPAARNTDRINVVEQITLAAPASGTYEIKVHGFSIPQGPQAYSIAYEFESGVEWLYPREGNSITAARGNFLRWAWRESPAVGKLEFKYESDAAWTELSANVTLASGYFSWVPPDTTARVQVRLTNGSDTYTSNLFFITQSPVLEVGYNCSEEVMLQWNSIPAATAYQLYRLEDQYLEPFLLTTDTFAILNSAEKTFLYYSLAPVIQGMEGSMGNTINYSTTTTGCYIISFLPQQFVFENEVRFDLTLGTTYKLGSIIFERILHGTPVEVQTISPVTTTSQVLTDTNPSSGKNFYRARLTDSNGITLTTSTIEEVFFAKKKDLFVYPNPVLTGESLNIVVSDNDTVRIRLFDLFGRLLQQTYDPGSVKTIDTSTLLKGSYILEVTKANGLKLSTRLVVR